MGSGTKSVEVGGSSSENKAVLDARSKSLVVFGIQRAIVETSKGSILIELDIVFRDVMGVFHVEVIEFERGGSDWIGLAEGGLEFYFKGVPKVRVKWQIDFIESKVQFKPTKCCSLKI